MFGDAGDHNPFLIGGNKDFLPVESSATTRLAIGINIIMQMLGQFPTDPIATVNLHLLQVTLENFWHILMCLGSPDPICLANQFG